MAEPRNPRRSYDRDGREIRPLTVAGHLAGGLHRVEVWCNDCVRSVSVSIDDLPPDLPITDVCLRYRCEQCDGRNLSSRMDFHEFYEMIDRRKREQRDWPWVSR